MAERRTGLFLASALLLTLPAFAGSPPAKTPSPQADPELIEFIGSWQGANGQWVDPMTFAQIDPAKVAADAARREGKLPPKPNPDNKNPGGQGERGT